MLNYPCILGCLCYNVREYSYKYKYKDTYPL